MNSWNSFFYFFIIGTTLLLDVLGLCLTIILPDTDRRISEWYRGKAFIYDQKIIEGEETESLIVDIKKSFSCQDRRSNQPEHSLKPKPNPEPVPNSLLFYED